ncbi:type II secretion system protein GspG [Thermodesulfovibrionales bacterium]|nr:type II secretion system protein GspG [Thermodesulfovibrionales bacterium]
MSKRYLKNRLRRFLSPPGFTLIEVLAVLVILGFFVAMAAKVFMGQDDQRRFDETRMRMGEIREAILGREGAFALGQRQFAGYVTDIGGLPALVDVDPGTGTPPQPVGLWEQGTLPGWGFQSTSRIWMGWRGPYLETPPRGDNILRDGWGNPFHFSISAGDMTITSLGADGISGGTGFDEDIALVIRRTEYMAPVAGQVGAGVTGVRIHFASGGAASSQPISGLTTGAFFRFATGATGAAGTANIDIPVGLRSIQVTGGSGRLYIFTVEPTANWLGTLE